MSLAVLLEQGNRVELEVRDFLGLQGLVENSLAQYQVVGQMADKKIPGLDVQGQVLKVDMGSLQEPMQRADEMVQELVPRVDMKDQELELKVDMKTLEPVQTVYKKDPVLVLLVDKKVQGPKDVILALEAGHSLDQELLVVGLEVCN